PYPLTPSPSFEHAWDESRPLGAYFHPVERAGRRVSRSDLDPEAWHEWKAELAKILRCAVGFFYQHFARGVRRVVFDGLEPTERFSESIQFEFFEHIYHHDLLTQPIGQGDICSNANTIILMGRTRQNGRMGRALAITKHRGSAHGDEIRPYRITEKGLVFD